MSKPKTKRNDQLFELRNSGWTFAQLAKKFKLSRQTCHEIYQVVLKKKAWAIDNP